MKFKNFIASFLFLSICLFATNSYCFDYYFNLGQLSDLEHGHYYTYGINKTLSENESIVYAALYFDDIYNWTYENNDSLYVHLLAQAIEGQRSYSDTVTGDEFINWASRPTTPIENILLAPNGQNYTYTDTSDTIRENFLYEFDTAELLAFNNYIKDGNFGLGFDPDCHYYNDGVHFGFRTVSTPEPASIFLLTSGIMGILGLKRKFI